MFSPDKTILDYFYEQEVHNPDQVFLKQPFGDVYKDYTWAEVGKACRSIVTYFKSEKLPPKSNIGIVSKNCAEWIIADLAIMMAGHISVPFYPTLTGEQLKPVLEHSECKYLFVGKLDQWEQMKPSIDPSIICISFPVYNPDPSHVQWHQLLSMEPQSGEFRPNLDDLFSIIYTSGTTGNPKGVMCNYRAMTEVIYKAGDRVFLDVPNARFFSYLPLSHIAERNIVEAACVANGGTIFFADSLETFAENLKSASPTHFLAVPRIWTKFQLGILSKIPQKKLNFFLVIPLIGPLLKKKIRAGLGLENAKVLLTGAAPMPISLLNWYKKMGLVIQEVYGMTENLGAVSLMPHDDVRDGTVGRLHPGVEVKIDPQTGEILTRSVWNMKGYFKEAAMTADTIDLEGWLHTGDVGVLDKDNFLTITGRVKEMYKTTKGEYVAPSQIEFGFAENEYIEQICVVGQNLPQPIALINLSEIGLKQQRNEIEKSLLATLHSLNPTLKSYEKVKKIVVLKESWSIANNKLTPSLKIKRNVIEKEYATWFDNWFHEPAELIWED